MRLYAEVETVYDAQSLVQIIAPQLHTCAAVVLRKVSPYWKIPCYYGFEFDFTPNSTHDAAFDCVVALCPTGWTFMGNPPERCAIWNPSEGAVLLAEQVRWADLDLFLADKGTTPSPNEDSVGRSPFR